VLVGRLWRDLARAVAQAGAVGHPKAASLRLALTAWLVAVVALPLASTAAKVVRVPPADAVAVSTWLVANVPPDALVETWEPEMEVFSDHRYHYPPPALLIHAVAHVARGGPAPATHYAFRVADGPEFVVVGPFARYVGLYAETDLAADYALIHRQGPYAVWKRRGPADNNH
jgi:hypothetical protein